MDAMMQSWVDRVNDAADKVLLHEGDARDLLLAWFETYVDLISMHKGGPAKITSAMGDEGSPIVTKCQTLCAATQRVVDRLSSWPRTFVHGEFYPSNVLVRRSGLAATMSRYLVDRLEAIPNVELHADTEVTGLVGDTAGDLAAIRWRTGHHAQGHVAEE